MARTNAPPRFRRSNSSELKDKRQMRAEITHLSAQATIKLDREEILWSCSIRENRTFDQCLSGERSQRRRGRQFQTRNLASPVRMRYKPLLMMESPQKRHKERKRLFHPGRG